MSTDFLSKFNPDKLTEFLNSCVERGIPSVDCIVYRDHKEIYRYLTGTVDNDRKIPVSKDQRYIMFSMTKVQTMTAVMQLIEQGKLSMEDEVGKYLPAYYNIKIKTDEGEKEADSPMLIKHLLSMQSGLDYDLSRPGILRVLKEKGSKATTRELVDSFTESPLLFNPGTHFCYSLSHDVAAAVIEVVSGKKFSEYLDENIWKPLGMNNTFFAKPDNEGVEGLARQFINNETGIVPMDQSCCYQLSDAYESGGAGLISTTEDYAALADTLACGGISAKGVRILKPETVELIKQNLLCDASMKEIAANMGRTGYGYGCGMQVLLQPELIGSKAPAGVFGWDGAAGSAIQMETKSKVSFVYSMHVRNCGFAYGEVHPGLREIIFGSI